MSRRRRWAALVLGLVTGLVAGLLRPRRPPASVQDMANEAEAEARTKTAPHPEATRHDDRTSGDPGEPRPSTRPPPEPDPSTFG